jgi:hypothetical protein
VHSIVSSDLIYVYFNILTLKGSTFASPRLNFCTTDGRSYTHASVRGSPTTCASGGEDGAGCRRSALMFRPIVRAQVVSEVNMTASMLAALLALCAPFLLAAFVMPRVRGWDEARQAKRRETPLPPLQLRRQLSSHSYLP